MELLLKEVSSATLIHLRPKPKAQVFLAVKLQHQAAYSEIQLQKPKLEDLYSETTQMALEVFLEATRRKENLSQAHFLGTLRIKVAACLEMHQLEDLSSVGMEVKLWHQAPCSATKLPSLVMHQVYSLSQKRKKVETMTTRAKIVMEHMQLKMSHQLWPWKTKLHQRVLSRKCTKKKSKSLNKLLVPNLKRTAEVAKSQFKKECLAKEITKP